MIRAFLSTLALLGLVALAPPQDELDLKHSIDDSVRWLRSRQDSETGLYGGGIEPTAWVLRAFAAGPRHYVRRDGPFVQRALDALLEHRAEDGSIADPGAAADTRLASTRAAAAALTLLADTTTRDALSGALAYLAAHGVDGPAAGAPALRGPDQAESRARALLAQRAPDGHWEGAEGEGAVLATARRLVELAAYAELLAPPPQRREVVPLPGPTKADAAAVEKAIARGARFLVSTAQQGRWGAPGAPNLGLTAMVVSALVALPEPRPAEVQRAIDAGLAWILSFQHEDGSIHDGKLAVYVTSAAIQALAGSRDPAHRAAVVKARDYLVGVQADEGEGYTPDHDYYGGIGYGDDERPDLSNLQMALEALASSGLEQDHVAFQRAVHFLERCQNRSESNDLRVEQGDVVVVPGDDGGAAYYPGDSPAGYVELPDGRRVPRSYGSMTYALLKSYVFAGLERDDPRVQACWDWLREHYTLDVNPGFEHQSDPSAPYQGLFYYLSTMARALQLFDPETLVDGLGHEHDWRAELRARLVAMQDRTDGSWVNRNASRWWEGNPVLATSYALLALAATREP